MLKKLLFLVLISHTSYLTSVNAQVNMAVAGHLDYDALHGTTLSDVWGYVDEDGNEYAIVGMGDGGISVVDITDPTDMEELFSTTGPASNWYEIKIWNNRAYVTTEGGGGLMIIDLSPLPGSANLTIDHFTTGGWQTAHNLWIDDNGILYIFGANRGEGGYIAYDLNIDPVDLTEVGFYDEYYIHDAIVLNDTMYAAHIRDGFFSIFDVADVANPVSLATAETPNHQTHNIWVSDDRNHVYTTDEVSGAYITEYDISDFDNISETDRIQSSPGEGVIPHNAYVVNDNYVISSYFNDGVVVYDVSHPGNMVEVGHYDTSPYTGTGFTGVWGTYNWLPSGNIIAGDVTEGLYILTPAFIRGAYLEGVVTDQVSGFPIPGTDVVITGPGNVDQSNLSGVYRMGTAQAGSYTVVFSKAAYRSDTIHNVVLSNGNVTTLDVQLEPLAPFQFSGTVTQAVTGTAIDSAVVRIENAQYLYELYTDASGSFNIPVFYEGTFDIYIGKWEFHTTCFNGLEVDSVNNVLNVQLEKGLFEDFTFDNGWVASASATRGLWEYGKPYGTLFGPIALHPGIDAVDCGDKAFTTGNDGNIYNEVDGTVTLTSPVFDATYISDPWIGYYRWFFNANLGTASGGNDTMQIMLSNGTETVVIEKVSVYTSINTLWNLHSERISDHLTPTTTMQFIVRVSDPPGADDQTEAGIDAVQLSPTKLIGIKEISAEGLVIYPNPANETITISMAGDISILDVSGRELLNTQLTTRNTQLDVSSLAPGIYYLRLVSGQKICPAKFIKR